MARKQPSPSVPNLLTRLDAWLLRYRPAYHARLGPGANKEELDTFQFALSLALPPAFNELYAWRNGQPWHFTEALQYHRHLMRLEDILDAIEVLNACRDYQEPQDWWSDRWVPFMDNGGHDHLFIDMEGAFGGAPGQIVRWPEEGEPDVVLHPSLEKWLETFVVTLEAGLWAQTENQLQPRDNQALQALARTINPGYPRGLQDGD